MSKITLKTLAQKVEELRQDVESLKSEVLTQKPSLEERTEQTLLWLESLDPKPIYESMKRWIGKYEGPEDLSDKHKYDS